MVLFVMDVGGVQCIKLGGNYAVVEVHGERNPKGRQPGGGGTRLRQGNRLWLIWLLTVTQPRR